MKKLIFIYILAWILPASLDAQADVDMEGPLIILQIDTINNSDQVLVRQMDGTVVSVNSTYISEVEPLMLPSLYPGWEDYGAGYGDASFYKDQNNVYFDGLIKKTSGSILNGDTIFILPEGYRPILLISILAKQQSKSLRLHIFPDGAVVVSSGSLFLFNQNWISLDGIQFYRNPIKIGDVFAGGIVYYIASPPVDLDGDGIVDRGIVVATEDISVTQWGCYNMDIPGANIGGLGGGHQNTIDIIGACFEPAIAAKLCDDFIFNGFNDWFLPSSHSLEIIMQTIGPAATGVLYNIGNFDTPGIYWSSSESLTIESTNANAYSTNSQSLFGATKTANYKVRAVRIF